MTNSNKPFAMFFNASPRNGWNTAKMLEAAKAGAEEAGAVSVALNGETLGTVNVGANRTALLYVEENKIVSGNKVKQGDIVAGWNTLAWKRVSGWVNYDWHKFTVSRPPLGMAIVID